MAGLEVWQRLAIGTVVMFLGWAVVLLVWEPAGLALVLVGFAVLAVTLNAWQRQALEESRRRRDVR